MPNPLGSGIPMGGPQNGGGPFGNILSFVNQFKTFKQNFKGDPRQQVQDMLNSGQMTQEQLEQCEKIAQSFQGLLR